MNPKSAFVHRPRKTASAFTLIELLVVISIIGVLAAMALPVFSAVRRKADQVSCASNIRQVTIATVLVSSENNGNFPKIKCFSWDSSDTDSIWIADCLNPYLASIPGVSPAKVIHCPAAQKNQKQAWLWDQQYPGYKYNVKYAADSKPLNSAYHAMLYFDTTWPDWTQDVLAHSPGQDAYLHVSYADGHMAAMKYKDYITANSAGNDEWNGDFFKLGWVK